MKRLYLIRHAKSSWNSPATNDFDRPLSDKGRSDAPRMADFLHRASCQVDAIVCSSAVRTRQTAEIIAKGIEFYAEEVRYDRRLYLADLNHLQTIMREFPEEWNTVAVIAHNPTLTDCANALANDNLENIPTCGVYGIELEIDSWLKLRSGVGKRFLFQVPRKLD